MFFYTSCAFANRASFSPPEIEKEDLEHTVVFHINTTGTLTVDESLLYCKNFIGNPLVQVIKIKETPKYFCSVPDNSGNVNNKSPHKKRSEK